VEIADQNIRRDESAVDRGWYVEPGAAAIWSKKRSVAELRVDSPARQLRIEGILPQIR